MPENEEITNNNRNTRRRVREERPSLTNAIQIARSTLETLETDVIQERDISSLDTSYFIEPISFTTGEPLITGNIGNSEYTFRHDTIYEQFRTLYTDKKEATKVNTKDKVTLLEGGKKAKYEDVVYIDCLSGYFLKTHPDLVKDCIYNEYYMILSEKYLKHYRRLTCIYTEIDENGVLFNPKYTASDKNYLYYPYVNIESQYHKFTSNTAIDLSLLNNTIFKTYYKESLINGDFYHISQWRKEYGFKNSKIQGRKSKSIYIAPSNLPSTYVNTWNKKYSFGLEIETSSGALPGYLDTQIDYSAVHDGSLRDEEGNTYGLEYVTGVLQGDKGLLQLKKLTNEIAKRCMINKQCGVHVHIGDVTFSKENVILMYHLYSKLEEEIFSMLPISRRKNEYCRRLTPISIDLSMIKSDYTFYIDKYYNDIIKLLAQTNNYTNNINKKKDHPKGHKCGYDHSAHRYCWVNFIPAVFNTRGNEVYTIEFRNHSATMSYYKCKQWLMICMALVDIVENHKSLIYENDMINLTHIIKTVYPKQSDKLLSYIEKRIIKFSTKDQDAENSDYIDNEVDEQILMKNL